MISSGEMLTRMGSYADTDEYHGSKRKPLSQYSGSGLNVNRGAQQNVYDLSAPKNKLPWAGTAQRGAPVGSPKSEIGDARNLNILENSKFGRPGNNASVGVTITDPNKLKNSLDSNGGIAGLGRKPLSQYRGGDQSVKQVPRGTVSHAGGTYELSSRTTAPRPNATGPRSAGPLTLGERIGFGIDSVLRKTTPSATPNKQRSSFNRNAAFDMASEQSVFKYSAPKPNTTITNKINPPTPKRSAPPATVTPKANPWGKVGGFLAGAAIMGSMVAMGGMSIAAATAEAGNATPSNLRAANPSARMRY